MKFLVIFVIRVLVLNLKLLFIIKMFDCVIDREIYGFLQFIAPGIIVTSLKKSLIGLHQLLVLIVN